MRKIIAAILALSITSITQAAYTIIIPMEQSKGGALPNGSITITPKTPSLPVENWQPAEPVYGSWINYGVYFGCDNEKWTGNKSGDRYDASNSTCKINQTRTVQEREFESTMLSYRDIGEEKTETRTLANQTYRNIGECTYLKDAWYWSVWPIGTDPLNPYTSNIAISPNGVYSGFSLGGANEINSYYYPPLSKVLFKGDFKTEEYFKHYEVCYIDL